MAEAPPVQFDHLSEREVLERLGELVSVSLRQKGACVLLARRTGEITVLDPVILDAVPLEEIASVLLNSWTEEEIEAYLRAVDERRSA
jgi:hypothetical protein